MIRTKGLLEAQRKLRKLRQAVSQGRRAPMEAVSKKAVQIIKARTLQSKDVNGNPFKPYSPKYAKKKRGPVNLRVSMDMLKAIQYTAWAKKARIYMKAGIQHVKARVHNFGGLSGRGVGFKMPQREFFGISKELPKLRKLYAAEWRKIVKAIGL